jgi:hypothetical protein
MSEVPFVTAIPVIQLDAPHPHAIQGLRFLLEIAPFPSTRNITESRAKLDRFVLDRFVLFSRKRNALS